MRQLHLVPPLMDDEPLESFASRVARRHGIDMLTFCSDVGLSVRKLVAGGHVDVGRLSDLTGVDSVELSRQAFKPRGGTWLFADQVLHRKQVRRIDLAICPRCLRDDVEGSKDGRDPYVRAHWLVKAVRSCPTHGVALAKVEDEGATLFGDRYHDVAARIAPTVRRLDLLVEKARPNAATRLEDWVVRCMTGTPRRPAEFLDAMPLYAATRTCEMLGSAALFGHRTRLRSLADADWRAAGEVGFDVATLGAEAITSCLLGLASNHGVASRNAGPVKSFGLMYRWLRSEESGPVYEPVRALLREIIIDTVPLPAGTDVLGVELDRRRVHSLRSAGNEMGQGLKGVRRELRASGVLPNVDGKGPGRLVTITVEQAEAARADAADGASRCVAASILGASAGDVARLAAAGLLGSGLRNRNTRQRLRFSRRDLAGFLDRLSAGVTGIHPVDADLCDIPTAAARSRRGLAAITTVVIEGRLHSVTRVEEGRGFRSLRVDANEIRSLADYDAAAWRSIDETAEDLRVNRFTALALVKEGHLAAVRMPSPLSKRTVLVVEAAQIAAFAQTFASLAALAERRGVLVRFFKARLDAAGTIPAFPGSRMRSAIYRVTDVDGVTDAGKPSSPDRRAPGAASQRGAP